jgi:hypothetical protein
MCSTRAALVVERRHDPRRERRRTATLDKLDQRVQVNRAFARQLLSQSAAETGLAQPGAPPGDRVVGSSARRRLSAAPRVSSGSEIHVSLAPAREPFLPANEKRGRINRPPRKRRPWAPP